MCYRVITLSSFGPYLRHPHGILTSRSTHVGCDVTVFTRQLVEAFAELMCRKSESLLQFLFYINAMIDVNTTCVVTVYVQVHQVFTQIDFIILK